MERCEQTCACHECWLKHQANGCNYGSGDSSGEDYVKDCDCAVIVVCDVCSKPFDKLLPTGYCETCWQEISVHCNGGSCENLPIVEHHFCSKECEQMF